MPLIGYARVSTEDQTPLPQPQTLKSAGCAEIHEEQASGGNRARPVLARVLECIGKNDMLVVVRIVRLARSPSHLLQVIERLEAKGAFFRSIKAPIDTVSPKGKFTLRVLGAAAEFERALIRERHWTQSRLLRAVRAYVGDGFLPAEALGRTGRRETDDRPPAIVAAIKAQISTSRFRRSVTGWKQCADGYRVDAPVGSRLRSRCCWSGWRRWGRFSKFESNATIKPVTCALD